jgi:hypothetical protein
MNELFYDPCPGISKILDVIYRYKPLPSLPTKPTKKQQEQQQEQQQQARGDDANHDIKTWRGIYSENDDHVVIRRLYRSSDDVNNGVSGGATSTTTTNTIKPVATFPWFRVDLILPFLLPYLPLTLRPRLSLVSKTFYSVINRVGVTRHIRVNDLYGYNNHLTNHSTNHSTTTNHASSDSDGGSSRCSNSSNSNSSSNSNVSNYNYTIGLITLSSPSLITLDISNNNTGNAASSSNAPSSNAPNNNARHTALTSTILSNIIPKCVMLRVLDLTRVNEVNDSVCDVIGKTLCKTLNVCTIKECKNVSDSGVISLCECVHLITFDISEVDFSDVGGVCIGSKLSCLKSLYIKDNSNISDVSVDAISEGCAGIVKFTAWNCVRLKSLGDSGVDSREGGKGRKGGKWKSLIQLNVSGCYNLFNDDNDRSINSMTELKSISVRECHRLNNRFIDKLILHCANIVEINLRYCMRINDSGLEKLLDLKHLKIVDVSFCKNVTTVGIDYMIRYGKLHELKCYNCKQLSNVNERDNVRGWKECVLEGTLDVVDFRECGFIEGELDWFKGPENHGGAGGAEGGGASAAGSAAGGRKHSEESFGDEGYDDFYVQGDDHEAVEENADADQHDGCAGVRYFREYLPNYYTRDSLLVLS